jgi:hypothetical protein
MNKPFLLIIFLILSGLSVINGGEPLYPGRTGDQDTPERQILYNGRIWRNLYYKIEGDPFLFSNEFLPGTVSISGKTFNNIKIRYDIFNDQILILTDKMVILQLNKEMVDGFTIKFSEVIYNFKNIVENDVNPVSGYVNILYDKSSTFIVKYKKEIDTSGSDNLFGVFYQLRRLYLLKDGDMNLISGRNDFLRLLSDKKTEVKNFIRQNKIKVSKKDPMSFPIVLAFYDTLI